MRIFLKNYFSIAFGLIFCMAVHAGDQVAKVIAVSGSASANQRPLSRGSALFQGDTVTTQAGGKVKFKFTDGTVNSLAEKTTYVIKNYSFNQGSKQNTFESKLLKGGLKTVTGKIGKEAKRTEEAIAAGIPKDQVAKSSNYKMQAGVASIGVRGTVFKTSIQNGEQPLLGLSFLNPPINNTMDVNDPSLGPKVVAVSAYQGTVEVDALNETFLVGAEGDSSYLEVSPLGAAYLTNDPNAGLDTEPDDGGDEGDDFGDGDDDESGTRDDGGDDEGGDEGGGEGGDGGDGGDSGGGDSGGSDSGDSGGGDSGGSDGGTGGE